MRRCLMTLVVCALSPNLMAQIGSFELAIPEVTGEYDPGNGLGTFSVRPSFAELDIGPPFPQPTQAFSFGIAHDSALLDITDIQPLEPLSEMNGGVGPDLWAPALLDDGVTIGVVYSFFGTEFLTLDVPTEILELSYATDPTNLQDNEDGVVTSLQWTESLSRVPGGPPVAIVVTANGETQDTQLVSGVVNLEPSTSSFVRGDLDGSGSVALPDPIFLLNYLFIPGNPAPPCDSAADVDDDGSIGLPDPLHILNHLFVPGSPDIPPPHPQCGSDPTPDDLECVSVPLC